MERMRLSENILISETTQETSTTFTVRGQAQETYEVDMSLPRCQCYDWCSTNYPCKHIFSISNLYHVPLPESYLENPWFTADEELFSIKEPSNLSLPVHEVDNDRGSSQEPEEPQPIDLPTRKRPKESLAAEIREKLRQVMNYTYLLTSNEDLELIDKKISEVLQVCHKNTPKSDSLPLQPAKYPKCRSMPQTKGSKPTKRFSDGNCSLPQKRRKFKYAGRVGTKAEGYKATININQASYEEQEVVKTSKETVDNCVAGLDNEKRHNSFLSNVSEDFLN